MTRPLTVHNAQITTAAVEVETLTISGKQVTLAVFRQLEEEQTTDRGLITAWGRVNHCPDTSCKRSARQTSLFGPWPAHMHVVWQKGDELRRTTVWRYTPDVDSWSQEARPNGRAVHPDVWAHLRDLPQLFIAV